MPIWTGGGTTNNWSDTGNWDTGVVPIATTDAIFNGVTGTNPNKSCTITSGAICRNLNFSGYSGTVTFTNTLTVQATSGGAGTGSITFSSALGFAVTGPNGINHSVRGGVTSTITTNGFNYNLPYLVANENGHTINLVGNFQVSNYTAFGVNGIFNGSELRISGNCTGAFGGSATKVFNGTGTISNMSARNSVINTTGTITIGSGTIFSSNLTIQAGTVNLANNLEYQSVSDSLTFFSGISFIGSGNLLLRNVIFVTGALNLTTNGVVFPNSVELSTTTITLLDNFTVNGDIITNTTGTKTITASSSRNINISGGWINSVTGQPSANSTVTTTNIIINFVGTGSIYTNSNSRFTNCTININTLNPSGYIIGNNSLNFFNLNNSSLTLVGTSVANVFNSSTILSIFGGTCTLNTNNTSTGANVPGGSQIIWGALYVYGSTTTVFGWQTTINSIFGLNSSVTHTINGEKILLLGGISANAGNTFAGTSTIEFTGSNNATWNSSSPVGYQNNITINKSGGATVSILSSFTWGAAGRTLQRTSGNINPGSSTVTIPNAAVTINNMVFNNLTITAGPTITQNSGNTVNGNLTCNGTTTFSGTAGFTTGGFICTTAASTLTLQSGVNYIVTSNLRLLGTNASPILLSSSSPTTRAFLTLNYGASMLSGDGLVSHAVYFVRATRIDSSLGQTIWNTFGSISTPLVDTVNWNPGSRPNPTSYTYIT